MWSSLLSTYQMAGAKTGFASDVYDALIEIFENATIPAAAGDSAPVSFSYAYNAEIWPAFITLALTIFLGAYSWRRRTIPAAKPFSIACVLAGFWALGAILELSAVAFDDKVFWVKFQAVWQLPVAAVIACFVLQYAGLGRWLTRRNYVLLLLFPLINVSMIVTNDYHHLIWAGFQMNGHLVASPGKLFWVFYSYIYLLGIVNFVALVRLAIYSPGHRLPVGIILSGQITARIGFTLDKLEAIGPGESVLFTLGVIAVAYAIALLRFHAIDPVAAARTAALQQMSQGLIVLDLHGRIVDVNPMAMAMLGAPGCRLRDKRLAGVMPVAADDLSRLENGGTGQIEIMIGKGIAARHYTLNLTVLTGRHDEAIGKLILLHDVTEQKRAQTRILEQQRVVAMLQERERLARELHDGIGQVLGYVRIQAHTALKWMQDDNNEKAVSVLMRLAEVAKDAHADVREAILCLKIGSGRRWSFISTLTEYIDRFQANYGIRTELSLAAGIDEETFDPGAGAHLLRAIQEALANARKHSGAHALTVRVERNGRRALISIADDGKGFDVSRLDRGDGGHFGLVFMRERMAQIGGSLEIESSPGGGTVLKLDVPVAAYREESQ